MRRILAIVIFAAAAAGATAAGAGVVVAPHIDPPGRTLLHAHAMAAYRLPIFLGVLRAKWDVKQGLLSSQSAFDLATIALALLVALWPRLPRPTLRPVADIAAARVTRWRWRSPLILGPPRAALP